ncbi:BTE_HP_G0164390.mRNA.1.CDS.1 [Saccharomyces cerevisiae]|nr:BTE_HP_G0164390.mRNA.1.CDS.1 [Saccharomyces cerevisiae]CAI7014831.1 BTE_HP_G0164390.mRNA.1.CDS.1 [Saccharomyces cerevisiae]
MTTGRINQITILKKKQQAVKKRNRNLFFFSTHSLLLKILMEFGKRLEIPEKLLFGSLCYRKCSLFKKLFTLLRSAPLRHPYHSTLWFPLIKVPPNRYPGVSRNGTFDIADLRGVSERITVLRPSYSTGHSPSLNSLK